MSVGEAVDLAELGSESVKVTTSLEPSGLHVEEVSRTSQCLSIASLSL